MKQSTKNHPRRQKKHNPQQLYGSVNQANTAEYYEMKKIRSNSCTSGGLTKQINGSICSSQRSFESEDDWESTNHQRSAKLMVIDLYHFFKDKLDINILKEFDKYEGQEQNLDQASERDLLHNLKQLMEIHFIQKTAEDKQLKEQYENDCANYDKSLQKLEAQVRDHIRIQQELRLLLEQAGQKNIEISQQMQIESQLFSQQKQLLEQAMNRINQKDEEISILNHNSKVSEMEINQLNLQLAAKINEICTYEELLGLAATRAISSQEPQHSGLRNHTEGAQINRCHQLFPFNEKENSMAAGNEIIPQQTNEKTRIQTIILQQKLSSFRNSTKQQGQQHEGQRYKEDQNQQQCQVKVINQVMKKNNENKNQFEQNKLLQFFKKDRLSQLNNIVKAEDVNHNSIRESQIHSEVTTMATEGVQSSRRKEVVSQKQTRSQSFYGRNGEDKNKQQRQSSLKRSSNANNTNNKGDNLGQIFTMRLKKSNESNQTHKGRTNSRDNSFVGVSRSFLDSSVVGEYFSNIKEDKLIFSQGQFLL